MKSIVLYSVLLLLSGASMTSLRNDFHELTTEEKITSFLTKYKNETDVKAKPYLASAFMKQAEYTIFPNKKLSYFNKGKKQLEAYISSYPNCVEGRYVRVLVQGNVPGILGYKKNIKSDKEFIKNNLKDSGLPASYQTTILENINKISP